MILSINIPDPDPDLLVRRHTPQELLDHALRAIEYDTAADLRWSVTVDDLTLLTFDHVPNRRLNTAESMAYRLHRRENQPGDAEGFIAQAVGAASRGLWPDDTFDTATATVITDWATAGVAALYAADRDSLFEEFRSGHTPEDTTDDDDRAPDVEVNARTGFPADDGAGYDDVVTLPRVGSVWGMHTVNTRFRVRRTHRLTSQHGWRVELGVIGSDPDALRDYPLEEFRDAFYSLSLSPVEALPAADVSDGPDLPAVGSRWRFRSINPSTVVWTVTAVKGDDPNNPWTVTVRLDTPGHNTTMTLSAFHRNYEPMPTEPTNPAV